MWARRTDVRVPETTPVIAGPARAEVASQPENRGKIMNGRFDIASVETGTFGVPQGGRPSRAVCGVRQAHLSCRSRSGIRTSGGVTRLPRFFSCRYYRGRPRGGRSSRSEPMLDWSSQPEIDRKAVCFSPERVVSRRAVSGILGEADSHPGRKAPKSGVGGRAEPRSDLGARGRKTSQGQRRVRTESGRRCLDLWGRAGNELSPATSCVVCRGSVAFAAPERRRGRSSGIFRSESPRLDDVATPEGRAARAAESRSSRKRKPRITTSPRDNERLAPMAA